MEREGQKMAVRFDFTTETTAPGKLEPESPKPRITGRFTSESQGALEYPLDLVTYSPPKLHFELGGGDTVFDGIVSEESLIGSFREGDSRGSFVLRHVKPVPLPYNREEVTFHNGRVTLAGTLLLPLSSGRHPAIIMAHGSGPQTRWGTPLFFADRFARKGIAALAFDKRGSGASTGDWKTASYTDLADDVIAGMRLLMQRKDIDPARIGIYGHSEGAMIAPLIAVRSPQVAFLIAADGHAGPIDEQELYRVRNLLIDQGFQTDEVARALAFYSVWLNIAAAGKGWDLLEAILPRVQHEKWFPTVEPPPKESWIWKWYPVRAFYDSLLYWKQVKAPVLLVFGAEDRTVNPATGMPRTLQALRTAGNQDFTGILIPGAQHNLTIQPGPGEPFQWWHIAPGYPDLLTAWVLQRVRAVR